MFSCKASTIYFGYRELQILEFLGDEMFSTAEVSEAIGVKQAVVCSSSKNLKNKGLLKIAGVRPSHEKGGVAFLWCLTNEGKKVAAKAKIIMEKNFPEGTDVKQNVAGLMAVQLNRWPATLSGKRKSTWKG